MDFLEYTIKGSKELEHSELKEFRVEAKDLLENQQFPTKKNEDWEYSNARYFKTFTHLAQSQFSEVPKKLEFELINDLAFLKEESYKIVLIDGVLNKELSKLPASLIVCSIQESFVKSPSFASKFNTLIDKNQFYCNINTYFMEEGLFIYVDKNTIIDLPIEIFYLNSEEKEDFSFRPIRTLFFIDTNSKITLIERNHTLSKKYFLTNYCSEIFLNENALLNYYKIQDNQKTAGVIDYTYISQKAKSQSFIYTFSFINDVVRNELSFIHQGENINSTLKGLSILKDSQECGNYTKVQHNYPNCESHELYKGIYDDLSKGIFSGKIIVDSQAQKTNAFQQNNSILLSTTAEVDTKPQLEIFADDVKCSHGCTVGQLDKEALFYMQSRGISEKEAITLLLSAFSSNILDEIDIPGLRDQLRVIIDQRLFSD